MNHELVWWSAWLKPEVVKPTYSWVAKTRLGSVSAQEARMHKTVFAIQTFSRKNRVTILNRYTAIFTSINVGSVAEVDEDGSWSLRHMHISEETEQT